ncbi:MAG: hypothetical protein QXD43_03105, partial [Candidatus Aenigmatarchaeota archaeon]
MEWIDEEILMDKKEFIFKRIEFPKSIYNAFLIILIIITLVGFKKIVLEEKKWSLLAKENLSIKIENPAARGLIFDRNKKILATNLPGFDLILDYKNLKEEEKNYFDKIINDNKLSFNINGNMIIIKNVPKKLIFDILIQHPNSPYIRVVNSYIRYYPYKEAFGNLLGYLGFPDREELIKYKVSPQNYVGKTGIEKTYQNFLMGEPGITEIEKDAKGNIIRTIKKTEPINGYNLELTINADFQEKAYKLMDSYFKENGYKKGGLIVMNPKTGEIISFISYPSY